MKSLTKDQTKQTIENLNFLLVRVGEMLGYLKDYINGEDVLAKVVDLEQEINNNQIKFDQENLAVALNSKLKEQNIRLILSAIRIFSDLERLADRVVDVLSLFKEMDEPGRFKEDILTLLDCNLEMFSMLLKAYNEADKDVAMETVRFDENINALKDRFFSGIIDSMLTGMVESDDGMRFTMIVSSLERLGDRIENVAEDIYYIITGDDIRYRNN